MAYIIVDGFLKKVKKERQRSNPYGNGRDWSQEDPTVSNSDTWRKESKLKYRQMRKQK